MASVVVSIHAPAWGATGSGPLPISYTFVSIHAPAWGATLVVIQFSAQGIVSIHAPAWGATVRLILAPRMESFQSTRPRGARRELTRTSNPACWFQSTRPRGARPSNGLVVAHNLSVSIHAPAWGATGLTNWTDEELQVSIHAPAWGATKIRKGRRG